MTTWNIISRLGSFNVTLALALAIAAWLVAGRAFRTAACWSLFFCTSSALVIASKIAFIGWGAGIASLDFTGISGHSARAAAVFPVLFFLILQRAPPSVRAAGVAFGLVLAAAVGIARVALHAHSISESTIGFLLGSAVGPASIQSCTPPRDGVLSRSLVLVYLLTFLAAFRAPAAPTQRWMTALALGLSGHDRPYIRFGWRLAPASWNHRNAGTRPAESIDTGTKPGTGTDAPSSASVLAK